MHHIDIQKYSSVISWPKRRIQGPATLGSVELTHASHATAVAAIIAAFLVGRAEKSVEAVEYLFDVLGLQER